MTETATAPPQSVAALLEGVLAHAPVGLAVEVRAGRTVRAATADPVVTAALRRASVELLRNVARHSGTDRAELEITEGVGQELVVRVVDHGRGIAPGTPEAFGLASSVRAAVADVGGTIAVLATPGGGTTVRLTAPPRLDEGEPYAEGLLRRTHQLTMNVTENRSLLRAITLPMTAAWLFVSVRHSWDAAQPAAMLGLAVAAAALTLGVGRRLASRPVAWGSFLTMCALTWVVQLVGMLLMPPGAMLDYRSWSVGFAVVPVVVLCYFAPVPVGLLLVASHVGLVLGAYELAPRLTAGAVPWGSLNAVVTTPLVGVALGWLLRRTGAAVVRERARLAAAREALARQRALGLVSSRHLEHTRERILPWLEEVARGEVPLDTAPTAARARLLGLEARDDLYAPGFFDPALRAEVSRFRRGGGTVHIHPGFESGHWPRHTSTVLSRLVRGLPPTSRVVLSVADHGHEVRAAVLHDDDGTAPPLPSLLAGLDVRVEVDSLRSTVVIAGRGRVGGPPDGGSGPPPAGAVVTSP